MCKRGIHHLCTEHAVWNQFDSGFIGLLVSFDGNRAVAFARHIFAGGWDLETVTKVLAQRMLNKQHLTTQHSDSRKAKHSQYKTHRFGDKIGVVARQSQPVT